MMLRLSTGYLVPKNPELWTWLDIAQAKQDIDDKKATQDVIDTYTAVRKRPKLSISFFRS